MKKGGRGGVGREGCYQLVTLFLARSSWRICNQLSPLTLLKGINSLRSL